jgi:hypothetical protein
LLPRSRHGVKVLLIKSEVFILKFLKILNFRLTKNSSANIKNLQKVLFRFFRVINKTVFSVNVLLILGKLSNLIDLDNAKKRNCDV